MKYKVLLTGKNNAIMDEFFDHMKVAFQPFTSSMRTVDLNGHIELFCPDILVYCMYNESKDDYNHIAVLDKKLREEEIVFVVIGSKEDCEDFMKSAVIDPDIILTKPLSAGMIQKSIVNFMEDREEERRKAEEAERLQQERLLQERMAEEARLEEIIQSELKQKDDRRKHVLVIDDDPMMLRLIKEHLQEKYDVATAVSGKIAYKFLENKKTDLILLDYAMPIEDGPAVLEKLRANEATKDIPTVFLTGITEKNKIQKALTLKPQGYLLKPIKRDKLMSTIKKLIG